VLIVKILGFVTCDPKQGITMLPNGIKNSKRKKNKRTIIFLPLIQLSQLQEID